MKLTLLTGVASLAATAVFPAAASPAGSYDGWKPPGDGDVRGPCPMLNTLANHGFLPHTGKGITAENTESALSELNIDKPIADFLFGMAKTCNPDENATTFDLSHLTRHNILEHDASLSRQDEFFGPQDVFNKEAFEESISYWVGPTIETKMAIRARTARVVTSAATNPLFVLSEVGSSFIYGETAGYLAVFGDREKLTAPKALVEYWFQNERLPTELGWKKPEKVITDEDLDRMMDILRNTTAQVMEDEGGIAIYRTKGGENKKRSVFVS